MPSKNENFQKLLGILERVSDLRGAIASMTWDRETYMPQEAGEARAQQMATLEMMTHELFTGDEIGDLLEDLLPTLKSMHPDSFEASMLRITHRDYEQARKIPSSLVEEMSRATNRSNQAWKQAFEESDFSIFRPHLEKVLDLTIQRAEALGYEDRIYDALLDEYEPDMKTAHLESIFSNLKSELVPIVHSISSREQPDSSFLKKTYDEAQQQIFCEEVIKDFHFNLKKGRHDYSVHPLTIAISIHDVRWTIHIKKNHLPSALFASFHECGHGLYFQGIDPALDRTILNDGASVGMHESQSRFWENMIGKSRDFWSYYYPRLQYCFPKQLKDLDAEAFYRGVNRVSPSPIRIEADEVTYNLHIILRFELEVGLMEKRFNVKDLPELWNQKMKDYLGITPENDSKGVLQDIHWSQGAIGYFPTYTLGNLISAQLYSQMLKDIPSFSQQVSTGRFAEILSWFREHVHRWGRKFSPDQLLQKITGSELQADSYLTYIRNKFSDIYGEL